MSLKAARTALAAQITTAVSGLSDVDVLAFDPPTVNGTVITVSTAGLTPTEHRLNIRIYVPTVQSSEGQNLLDDIVDAVEANALSEVPGAPWTFSYDDRKAAFLMTTVVELPRKDF